MTEAFTMVGRPVDRVEGTAKVTGRARYTADTEVTEPAHAVLVQSGIPFGEVTEESLRDSAARASGLPGVLHVLTPLNCPPLHAPPPELTFDLPVERRPPLSDLMVHHVGQHMALVAADTLENAVAAASSFGLRYRPVPPGDDPAGRIRYGSYYPDHFVKLEHEKLQDRRGSQPAGTTGERVTEHYATARNTHYPIELSATIAEWDGDLLTVHDTTRWITGERTVLAAYLGLPESNIRIISPLVGGAFGSKSFLWMHVVLCAVAARAVGRPVKLVLTRAQMFSSTGHRPGTEQDVVLAAGDDGAITSTEHHAVSATSTVAHFCEPVGLSSRFLYQSPHLVVTHRVDRINGPTPCFMRGPGEAPGLFALESATDELAYRLGVDPVEFRIRNHADLDQTNGRTWSGKHLRECYEAGAQRFGWDKRPAEPRSLSDAGVQIGWGMATATYPGRRMPASCRVTTGADGVVRFASATHEIGTGVRTAMCQVAADATGLPMTRVVFDSGDSSFPDAPYSGASQTTATVGSAVLAAAQEWRRRLLRLATNDPSSPFHGCAPKDLALSASVMAELAAVADHAALSFEVSVDAGDRGGPVSQSFGAHFCEVAVDERIGRATVTRWVAMLDCGRVVNPKLARNQVMGGITFGVGMALLEQVVHDPATEQLIGEYYVPTHADRPDFEIGFVDAPDYGLNPIGVRGIGEIGACGVPGAVANAIFHATGKRLRSLPITLEQLMQPWRTGEETR